MRRPRGAPRSDTLALDPARLREAFGIFPTGVVAVAAEVGGRLIGLAVSSFTSVSLEPPLVSINLAVPSKTWPDLRRAGHVDHNQAGAPLVFHRSDFGKLEALRSRPT